MAIRRWLSADLDPVIPQPGQGPTKCDEAHSSSLRCSNRDSASCAKLWPTPCAVSTVTSERCGVGRTSWSRLKIGVKIGGTMRMRRSASLFAPRIWCKVGRSACHGRVLDGFRARSVFRPGGIDGHHLTSFALLHCLSLPNGAGAHAAQGTSTRTEAWPIDEYETRSMGTGTSSRGTGTSSIRTRAVRGVGFKREYEASSSGFSVKRSSSGECAEHECWDVSIERTGEGQA